MNAIKYIAADLTELASKPASADGSFELPFDGLYYLEMHGGGSGGAGEYYNYATGEDPTPGGPGGGSGAYIDELYLSAGSYTYTIGAGGSRGNINCNSSNGGYTYFYDQSYIVAGGTIASCKYGYGGGSGNATTGMTNMASLSGNGKYGEGYLNYGKGGSSYGPYGNGGCGGYSYLSDSGERIKVNATNGTNGAIIIKYLSAS